MARTLKGKITDNVISFQLIQPDVFMGYGRVGADQVGMFFLIRDAYDTLTVTSPYDPSVVAALEAPESSSSGDLNNVISEVVNVITSPKTSASEKFKAVDALDNVRVPVATEALHKAADSSNQNLSISAIATLLRRNDIYRLEIVEKILANIPVAADQNLLTNLASSLQYARNPQAIPSLARLLNSSFVQARRSAAAALQQRAITPRFSILLERCMTVIGKYDIRRSWGLQNNRAIYLGASDIFV